jgi:hypothetical protein
MTTFHGVAPGKRVQPLGQIDLPVWFGTPSNFRKEMLTFEVVGFRAPIMPYLGGLATPSLLLGNSGKPVTLGTLSLTKFSKYVFQEQGIRDSQEPGTCEVSNSRMC